MKGNYVIKFTKVFLNFFINLKKKKEKKEKK